MDLTLFPLQILTHRLTALLTNSLTIPILCTLFQGILSTIITGFFNPFLILIFLIKANMSFSQITIMVSSVHILIQLFKI